MKFYILFFSLVNGIIGTVVNQPSKCKLILLYILCT